MVNPMDRVAQKLRDELKAQDRSVLWLEQVSGISRTTINRRLVDSSKMTVREMVRIGGALGIPASEIAELAAQEQTLAA